MKDPYPLSHLFGVRIEDGGGDLCLLYPPRLSAVIFFHPGKLCWLLTVTNWSRSLAWSSTVAASAVCISEETADLVIEVAVDVNLSRDDILPFMDSSFARMTCSR